MMCMSGTPKGMEASLSASFWISALKASLSPFTKGSIRLFRIFSSISTLFCARHALPQDTASASARGTFDTKPWMMLHGQGLMLMPSNG